MSGLHLNDVSVPSESEPHKRFTLKYDEYNSPHSFNILDYEDGVIKAHEELTQPEDDVAIVGAGWGVTTVRTSQIIGDLGTVKSYEGGEEQYHACENIIKYNDCDNNCDVFHSIVGENKGVYGEPTENIIRPDELPECDVLELDCEGSELEIIQEMTIKPRVLIMELHPWAYTDEVMKPLNILQDLGYKINYRSGHDGVHINKAEFQTLFERSKKKMGNHDVKKDSKKYLDNGARWPVVVAGEKTE